jgi:hypothetical protein
MHWDSLHAPRNVLQYLRTDETRNWSIAEHISLRADAETYALVSTYAGDGTWAPFEDELFHVRTDGGGFVRLGHTRSYQLHPDSAVLLRAAARGHRSDRPLRRLHERPRLVVAHGRHDPQGPALVEAAPAPQAAGQHLVDQADRTFKLRGAWRWGSRGWRDECAGRWM